MNIEHARVLITGGSRGIGLATAKRLVELGAKVAVSARMREALDAAHEVLGCTVIQGDVGNPSDAARMVAEAGEALGGLDVVVNNAAIGTFAKLVDTNPDDVESVFRVNVLGPLLIAQNAVPYLIDAGGGTILNVGSTAARKGFPGGSAYASSKFALSGLTECWRAELREHGIRVMQINPSEVQTGFGGNAVDPNPTKLQADDIAEAIVAMLQMPDRGFTTETTVWATNPQ